MKDRIEYIDIARGITMLSVILGHCYTSADDSLNKFILSFHMMLFFFLLGLLCKSAIISKLRKDRDDKITKILLPQKPIRQSVSVFCSAISGIFSILYLSMFIKESRFLMYIGKNSIAFYVWQFAVTSIFVSAFDRLLPHVIQTTDRNIIAFLAFACSMPILLYIVFITNRYFPSIYNLKKVKS